MSYSKSFNFGSFVGVMFLFASCIFGEPCEETVGKELVKFTYFNDVDSIEIEQDNLFKITEFEDGRIYNSGWRNFKTDSIDITVYISSISSRMQFAVENNKTLSVILSDTSSHSCQSTPPYQSFKINNAEACFHYDSLSCP